MGFGICDFFGYCSLVIGHSSQEEAPMVVIVLMLIFLSVFSFILGIAPINWESRPTLNFLREEALKKDKKRGPFASVLSIIRKVALINKPFTIGLLGKRMNRDLAKGRVKLTPEEFFFTKEAAITLSLAATYPYVTQDMMIFGVLICFAFGYMLPEFWLKGKIKKVQASIVRELPDAIDLLTLCVNAGLDFMLALKWVVEKSAPSIMISEFNTMMQEINLGKTRRDAIRDLATKYELADLSTLARTLIQADKMGTSVAEALNILSEDMRLSRFRRGEQMALKAPLKMLVPLLLFIFPVVGVLVAGPIFLDFIQNNPMQNLGR